MRKPGGRVTGRRPGVRSTRRPVGHFLFLPRLAVAVAAVCGLSLCFAPGASAGGPTSVLVTSPDSGEATALSVSDPRYARLRALLGPASDGAKKQPQSLDGAVGTRQINVTWMVHDLEPMRTDRVFPGDDPDTVWIHTASEVPYTYRGYWHRAKKPTELAALFKQLGLLGKKNSEAAYGALFPQPWEDRAAGPAPALRPAASASAAPAAAGAPGSSDRFDGVWWAVPGLVAGAALALALRSLAARRGGGGGRYGRESGPRQELLDL
ncbi:hypothetical protein [Streptomyces atratus]|uniref:hypothetical protein n=1 Tax=Streptomyces atratus TaxID=1893 RepID=UPI0033F74F65